MIKKLLLFVLVAALAACEGPQGPPGAIGGIGPKGPQGEPGTDATNFMVLDSAKNYLGRNAVRINSWVLFYMDEADAWAQLNVYGLTDIYALFAAPDCSGTPILDPRVNDPTQVYTWKGGLVTGDYYWENYLAAAGFPDPTTGTVSCYPFTDGNGNQTFIFTGGFYTKPVNLSFGAVQWPLNVVEE